MRKKNQLKICIIPSPYPYELDPYHGSFIREQATALGKKSLQVHIIALGENVPKEEKDKGVTVHRIMNINYKYKNLFLFIYLFKVFLKVVKLNKEVNFDLIHSHFADHAGLAGLITSKILKKPFILNTHGYDIYYEKESQYGWGQSWLSRF